MAWFSNVRALAVRALSIRSLGDLRREEGQTLVEYALILSLVAVVVIVAVTTLGGKVKGIFSSVSSQL